jgi:hypothetical protein
MTQNPDIRRLSNGTIDYDFYRDRALVMRSEAMREMLRPRAGSKTGSRAGFWLALSAAGALAVVTVAALPLFP